MLAVACSCFAAAATPEASAPLVVEARIPLGDIRGRIDHLAVDLPRKRVFVAELGNDTVAVVDLAGRRVERTLTGFREPQGIAYLPARDEIHVADGGDGILHVLSGSTLQTLARIHVGDDADNVRIGADGSRIYVGYGAGGIAEIDAASRRVVRTYGLKAHPESFRLDDSGERIFVNVPGAGEITVIDRRTGTTESWPQASGRANFPMVVARSSAQVLVVFRSPPLLAALDSQSGRLLSHVEACADADDLFLDEKRNRIYMSCGDGRIQVFAVRGETLESLTSVATVPGARTSLFIPELDRLVVAVRATGKQPAALWVLRPTP